MKRWSNTVTKRIMVLLMSVSLMGSPFMKAVPVYATQTTTQESTEIPTLMQMEHLERIPTSGLT